MEKEQRELLKEITLEQRNIITDYTLAKYNDINVLCRYDGDRYVSCDRSSIKSDHEYYKALEAIQYPKHKDVFTALTQNKEAYEDTLHNIEVLDKLTMYTLIPDSIVVRKDIVMERVIPFLEKSHGNKTFKLEAGSLWKDKAFVSTSLNIDHIYQSAYDTSQETSLFLIELPKGSPGVFVPSILPETIESEMLLPRNSAVEIDRFLKLDKSQLPRSDQKTLQYLPKYVIQGRYIGIGDSRFDSGQ